MIPTTPCIVSISGVILDIYQCLEGNHEYLNRRQIYICVYFTFLSFDFVFLFFGESRSSFGELVGLKPINNLNVKMEIFCLFFDTQVAALLSLHLSFKAIKFKLKKPSINKTQTKQPITY